MIYNTNLLLLTITEMSKQNQTLGKIEYQKEFQQRLDSRQITPKYKNTQKITDRMCDTCSNMSKVQNNQLEITKEEVQLAIKTLPAHKCHDTAGLKNEVLRSGNDSFLNSITKILNSIKKISNHQNNGKYIFRLFKGKGSKKVLNNYRGMF